MAPRDSSPAAPWALLWLGGLAGASWLTLLLADRLASEPVRSASTLDRASAPPGLDRTPPPELFAAIRRPFGSDRSTPAPPLAGPAAQASPAVLPLLPAPGQQGGSGLSVTLPAWRPRMAPQPSPFHPADGRFASRLTLTAAASPFRLDGTTPSGPPLSGALLLGGTMGLESLQEKAVVPAARLERLRRAGATDRLSALPLHWRRDMQALLGSREQILPAEIVRMPVPHLRRPEEIPLAVRPGRVADTTVQPSSPRTLRTLEHWVERQPSLPQGQVRPVVVVLEPLPSETPAPEPAPPVATAVPPAEGSPPPAAPPPDTATAPPAP